LLFNLQREMQNNSSGKGFLGMSGLMQACPICKSAFVILTIAFVTRVATVD